MKSWPDLTRFGLRFGMLYQDTPDGQRQADGLFFEAIPGSPVDASQFIPSLKEAGFSPVEAIGNLPFRLETSRTKFSLRELTLWIPGFNPESDMSEMAPPVLRSQQKAVMGDWHIDEASNWPGNKELDMVDATTGLHGWEYTAAEFAEKNQERTVIINAEGQVLDGSATAERISHLMLRFGQTPQIRIEMGQRLLGRIAAAAHETLRSTNVLVVDQVGDRAIMPPIRVFREGELVTNAFADHKKMMEEAWGNYPVPYESIRAYDLAYLDRFHQDEKVSDWYDQDNDLATALNRLIENFEYPNFSHLTIGEVRSRLGGATPVLPEPEPTETTVTPTDSPVSEYTPMARAIWIPAMKPRRLDNLLAKETLNADDVEALEDFKFFLINQKQDAFDKGFYLVLETSGQAETAYVLKNKFLLVNIDHKLNGTDLVHDDEVIKNPKVRKARKASKAKTEVIDDRIDDVGEKIGGARKDFYSKALSVADLANMNDQEVNSLVKKANIWPWSVKEALEEGAEPGVLQWIKTLRRNIREYGEKARWGGEQTPEDFIRGVSMLRDGIGRPKNKAELVNNLKSFRLELYEQGLWQPFDHPVTHEHLSSHQYYETPFNTVVMAVSHKAFDMANNEVHSFYDTATQSRSEPRFVPCQWRTSKAQYFEEHPDYGLSKLMPVRRTSSTVEETTLVMPERPHLANLVHAGFSDIRGGRDIEATELLSKFGFRAIEFGNWVPQDERQTVINMAYDGMHALCETAKIDPLMASLHGELALAFGSRGKGGKGAGLAHYESSRKVINLTRIKGAGSLMHEWIPDDTPLQPKVSAPVKKKPSTSLGM